jgi:hypothetical protein
MTNPSDHREPHKERNSRPDFSATFTTSRRRGAQEARSERDAGFHRRAWQRGGLADGAKVYTGNRATLARGTSWSTLNPMPG